MSGSTIGGVVGGIAGFFIGGPAGAQIGFTIGSLVGGYVDPEQIIGPRLTDARTQTSQVGIPIPFGYGTFATAGNIIWGATYDGKPLREVRREESAKGGPEQVTFSYYRSYAIGICQGPIAGVLQIKRNGKVVYDARTDAEIELQLSGAPAEQLGQIIASIRANNAKFINRATIYLGDETQVADSLMESFEGVGEVSAFRGLAYMVVEEDDLTQLSGAIPQYEFVVAMAGVAEPVSISGGSFEIVAYVGDGTTSRAIGTLDMTGGGMFMTSEQLGVLEPAIFEGGSTFNRNNEGVASSGSPIALSAGVQVGSLLSENENGEPYTAFLLKKAPRFFDVVRFTGTGSPQTIAHSLGLAPGCVVVRAINPGVTVRRAAYHSAFGAGVSTRFAEVFEVNTANIDAWNNTPPTTGSFTVGASDLTNAAGQEYIAVLFAHDPAGIVYCGSYVGNGSSSGPVVEIGWEPNFILTMPSALGLQSILDTETFPGLLGNIEPRLFAGYTAKTPAPYLETSATGYQVVTSDSWFNSAGETYAFIAVRTSPCAGGIAIPDAPGSFVNADGTICVSGEQSSIAPNQIVLASIVADLLQREGLTADDYDVSELTDLVDGYGPLATEAGADSFIAPLTQAYFFDPGEWDGKLRFIKRGGAVAYSLGPDDLAERDGDAIEQRRVQEAELLRKVIVLYRDPAAGYGIVPQDWERRASTVEAKGEKTVEVNVVTDADTAKRIAAKRGKVAWSETEEFKFSLPYGVGAKCTPTDVVSLTDKAGKVHRVRLMNVEEDSGVIEVEAVKDVQAAYTSNVSGVSPAPPAITTPGLIGPTTLEVMNLPVLRDQDDELGVYVALRGVLGGWRGAQVQISIDGGASVYTTVEKPDPSVIGYTTTDLAGWVSGEYPSPSSVTVYLPEAPESVTYEALLQYNNRAAIQLDSGEWSILQYQTVVANGGNSYTLSGLVLGRYNTDTGPATSGAAFVLLDSSVTFVQAQTWMLGQTLSVRAVSYGTSADGIAWESFAFTPGASQTEWPVHNVEATRDAGTDDVIVTWIGRARLGVETAPRHSKYFAGYRVAWDDGSTVTTADTTDATYTIPAAADPIDVTVTPLNSITGEGPASEALTV